MRRLEQISTPAGQCLAVPYPFVAKALSFHADPAWDSGRSHRSPVALVQLERFIKGFPCHLKHPKRPIGSRPHWFKEVAREPGPWAAQAQNQHCRIQLASISKYISSDVCHLSPHWLPDKLTLAGLGPAIFGSEDQRLIH
jgi:hypothetical protein